MTYPPPDRVQWAFAAYPRPDEAEPAVFHGPIARGQALDSPGLPRPTAADEQTTRVAELTPIGGTFAKNSQRQAGCVTAWT